VAINLPGAIADQRRESRAEAAKLAKPYAGQEQERPTVRTADPEKVAAAKVILMDDTMPAEERAAKVFTEFANDQDAVLTAIAYLEEEAEASEAETAREGEPAVVLPDEDCDDIVGVDARLAPLANNGGPTMTHALRPDSPALDAACDGLAISDYIIDFDDIVIVLGDSGLESGDFPEPGFIEGAPVESDQRGESRPIDGDADGEAVCDSGAFAARPDIVMQGGAGGVLAPATAEGNCSTVAVTVRNEGDAPLLLDSIEFEGSNAGDFSLGSNVTGTVLQPGQSIRIPVRFCPKADGRRVARMLVYSTDPDEPVVEVGLTGRARQERAVSPAEMNTSYLLIDPVQVLPGQQVTVSANICNNGEERGSHPAALSVNGVAEQSQSIAVSGGSCQTVVFAVSRAVPGTYQVSVDGMQGQFSVLAPRTVQASVPSQQDTGLGTVGLIAVIGVGLALIGALVVLFRQT